MAWIELIGKTTRSDESQGRYREVAFTPLTQGFGLGEQITKETIYRPIAGLEDGAGGAIAGVYTARLWVANGGKAYYSVKLPDFEEFVIQLEDNGVAQPVDISALRYGSLPVAQIPPTVLDAIAGLVTSGERTLQFQQTFTPTEGQSVFILAQIPDRPEISQLIVNGVEQTYLDDYTIEGAILTYRGAAIINPATEFKLYSFRL